MLNLRFTHGLRGKGRSETPTYAQPQSAPSLFGPVAPPVLGAPAEPAQPCGECAKRKALGQPCCGRGR